MLLCPVQPCTAVGRYSMLETLGASRRARARAPPCPDCVVWRALVGEMLWGHPWHAECRRRLVMEGLVLQGRIILVMWLWRVRRRNVCVCLCSSPCVMLALILAAAGGSVRGGVQRVQCCQRGPGPCAAGCMHSR